MWMGAHFRWESGCVKHGETLGVPQEIDNGMLWLLRVKAELVCTSAFRNAVFHVLWDVLAPKGPAKYCGITPSS